jgi:hypothetical protein
MEVEAEAGRIQYYLTTYLLEYLLSCRWRHAEQSLYKLEMSRTEQQDLMKNVPKQVTSYTHAQFTRVYFYYFSIQLRGQRHIDLLSSLVAAPPPLSSFHVWRAVSREVRRSCIVANSLFEHGCNMVAWLDIVMCISHMISQYYATWSKEKELLSCRGL